MEYFQELYGSNVDHGVVLILESELEREEEDKDQR